MPDSWQNRRRGKSLVANEKSEIKKIKRLQQNKIKITFERTDWWWVAYIQRSDIAFQICGAAKLKARGPIDVYTEGFANRWLSCERREQTGW